LSGVEQYRGTGIDQPLGILRMGYVDQRSSSGSVVGHRQVPPFLIVPLWDTRGQATRGVFADGGEKRCETRNGHLRCIFVTWPNSWFVLTRPNVRRSVWHGTLIEDKADAAGTIYRRNRYYDPATGRFTQEDPIGLRGGLNLYGYANGDPVNFHDPFGLSADCRKSPGGCPTPQKVFLDTQVRERAEEMYKETLLDGKERGAVVSHDADGNLSVGPTIVGTARNIWGVASVPGLRNPPEDAAGIIHTHPGDSTTEGPSESDFRHAARNHVYSVVRDPAGLWLVNPDGSAAYKQTLPAPTVYPCPRCW
jgi:RHS repeat-associated protein